MYMDDYKRWLAADLEDPALTDELGGLPSKWSTDTCHPNLECYRTVMEPMVCDAVNKVLKTPKKKLHTAMPVE